MCLSNEVARLAKVVDTYEISFKCAQQAYKKALAKAIVIHKDMKIAIVVKAMAESEPYVQELSTVLEQAEALLIKGKAELDGRDKQYQGIKKLIDLKVQELRTFRG